MLMKIALSGLAGIADGSWDFNSTLILLRGSNGAGKSTLMSHAHPFPKTLIPIRDATLLRKGCLLAKKSGLYVNAVTGVSIEFDYEYKKITENAKPQITGTIRSKKPDDSEWKTELRNAPQTACVALVGDLIGLTVEMLKTSRILHSELSLAQVDPAIRKKLLMLQTPVDQWFYMAYKGSKLAASRVRDQMKIQQKNYQQHFDRLSELSQKLDNFEEYQKTVLTEMEAIEKRLIGFDPEMTTEMMYRKLDEEIRGICDATGRYFDGKPLKNINPKAIPDETITTTPEHVREQLAECSGQIAAHESWLARASSDEGQELVTVMSESELEQLKDTLAKNADLEKFDPDHGVYLTQLIKQTIAPFFLEVAPHMLLTGQEVRIALDESREFQRSLAQAKETLERLLHQQEMAARVRQHVPEDCHRKECFFVSMRDTSVSADDTERLVAKLRETITDLNNKIAERTEMVEHSGRFREGYNAWIEDWIKFTEELPEIAGIVPFRYAGFIIEYRDGRKPVSEMLAKLEVAGQKAREKKVRWQQYRDLKQQYEVYIRMKQDTGFQQQQKEFQQQQLRLNSLKLEQAKLRAELERVVQNQVSIEIYNLREKYHTVIKNIAELKPLHRRMITYKQELADYEERKTTAAVYSKIVEEAKTEYESLESEYKVLLTLAEITDMSTEEFMAQVFTRIRNGLRVVNAAVELTFQDDEIIVDFDPGTFRFPVTVNGLTCSDVTVLSDSQKPLAQMLIALAIGSPVYPKYLDEVDAFMDEDAKVIYPRMLIQTINAIWKDLSKAQIFIISHTAKVENALIADFNGELQIVDIQKVSYR